MLACTIDVCILSHLQYVVGLRMRLFHPVPKWLLQANLARSLRIPTQAYAGLAERRFDGGHDYPFTQQQFAAIRSSGYYASWSFHFSKCGVSVKMFGALLRHATCCCWTHSSTTNRNLCDLQIPTQDSHTRCQAIRHCSHTQGNVFIRKSLSVGNLSNFSAAQGNKPCVAQWTCYRAERISRTQVCLLLTCKRRQVIFCPKSTVFRLRLLWGC